jgi:uncharacterized protein (TIGR02246 family)
MTQDERAIRELVDSWMKASKAGDLATVLDLMTDDVVFMVPGREPFGKEEFRAASESMSGAKMDGNAEIREMRVLGDWAWIRSHIDIGMTPPDGRTRAPVRLHADHPAQGLGRPLAARARCQSGLLNHPTD